MQPLILASTLTLGVIETLGRVSMKHLLLALSALALLGTVIPAKAS